MKTVRTTRPALLVDDTAPYTCIIDIRLSGGRQVEIRCDDRRLANLEYTRIRNMGIYVDSWIESIEFREVAL